MNFTAFYLGAFYFEHSGLFCGVAVFLVTALAGTIVASAVEKCVATLWGKVLNRCVDRIARYSAESVYFGMRTFSEAPVQTERQRYP